MDEMKRFPAHQDPMMTYLASRVVNTCLERLHDHAQNGQCASEHAQLKLGSDCKQTEQEHSNFSR